MNRPDRLPQASGSPTVLMRNDTPCRKGLGDRGGHFGAEDSCPSYTSWKPSEFRSPSGQTNPSRLQRSARVSTALPDHPKTIASFA
jgi:hypothetical protein